MYLASVSRVPSKLVFATRSDPAKSMIWSLDSLIVEEQRCLTSRNIVNILCDRDEAYMARSEVKHILYLQRLE